MTNPYTELPDFAFWRRAVAGSTPQEFDPVVEPTPFKILPQDRVATAGSCFAQHISRTLVAQGFNYLITEPGPAENGFGIFPARFGNIYTIRQMLQLLTRAYGLFEPEDKAWRRPDGRFVDPFRQNLPNTEFGSESDVEADREQHLIAVQEMFESCDVFVFTLGLTEGWINAADGAAFPLAPGVIGEGNGSYRFENFPIASMCEDFASFVARLRAINPLVRIILTVSPVPLIATYESQHVLVSTTYSKSALRVVAETVARTYKDIAYFPSYEIITGPQARGRYYGEDLREVTPDGVAHVMSVFRRHYMAADDRAQRRNGADRRASEREAEADVICDEEILDS